MKALATLFFFVMQLIQINAQSSKQKIPVIIINDITITSNSYLNFIDPYNIENIRVIQKSAQYPDGEMIITLKNDYNLLNLLHSKLLSLKEITKINLAQINSEQSMNYVLNGQLLKDTTGILIPEICLTNVRIKKASEEPYYKIATSDALLIMISTNPKWTPPDPSKIYIRGSSKSATAKKSN